jgi:hypothetical protein
MTATTSVRPSTGIADPNNPPNVLTPNITGATAVTKSNSTVYDPPFLGLYVGGTGGVTVRMANGDDNIAFLAIPAGTFMPISVDKVYSTGTDASDIVGLR